MRDVWRLVDRALSDTGSVVLHPRNRRLARMHAVTLLLSLKGLQRHRPGSETWWSFRELYDYSARGLEEALGSDASTRVVDHMADLARERDVISMIS